MTYHRLALLSLTALLCLACEPISDDPNNAINGLVKDFGYIGFQNPLSNASTGVLLAGRPSSVAFVAPANDCFPSDNIERQSDFSEYSRVYKYSFLGSLGFLAFGNPIISAGAGLSKSVLVEIEMSGLTTEYLSSIAITNWYNTGMSATCQAYLNDVGFIIQALKSDKLKISFRNKKGAHIKIDADNVSQYVGFNLGTSWEIEDNTTISISSPRYIGYQLGRLRLEDQGRSLWRAMTKKDDKYVFERISVFQDRELQAEEVEGQQAPVKRSQLTDKHAVYLRPKY